MRRSAIPGTRILLIDSGLLSPKGQRAAAIIRGEVIAMLMLGILGGVVACALVAALVRHAVNTKRTDRVQIVKLG